MKKAWEQLKTTLLLKAKEVLRHEKAYLFAAPIDTTKPYDTLTSTEIVIPFDGHVWAYKCQIVQHAGRHFKSSTVQVDDRPADKKIWKELIKQIEGM
jgi:hypothetical protein